MFAPAMLLRLCPQTEAHLVAAQAAIVAAVAPVLEAQAAGFGLVTILRRAHFLAQLAYESAGFARLVEDMDYSADRIGAVWPRLALRAHLLMHSPEKLANAAYAGRLGNGNEASGDGWRFRGRGLVQITGRDNYSVFGAAAGVALLANPDRAAEPATAARIALALWRSRHCNALADLDNVEAVTRAINGPALAGIEMRRALTAKAKAILAQSDLVA
jgi:putative chitinase